MSLLNYGDLKTEIADWLVKGNSKTLAKIPDFIRLAETELYRGLEVRDNEFYAEYTQDDDPTNPILLPENFQSFKVLTFNDKPLDRESDQKIKAIQYSQDTSPPHSFTTLERELIIAPWVSAPDVIDPDAGDFKIGLHYYGTESITQMEYWNTATNPNIPPTTDGLPTTTVERGDDATTRLFLRNPDIYLAGALAWGFLYVKNKTEASLWNKIHKGNLKELSIASKRARRSGSTPRVAGAYEAPDSRTYRDTGTGASRYW